MFIDLEKVDNMPHGTCERCGHPSIMRICVTCAAIEKVIPLEVRPTTSSANIVYMVVHQMTGGNECGAVVSIWTNKEDAEKERHRLRSMTTIGSAWDYEVCDAPLNKPGTMTLN